MAQAIPVAAASAARLRAKTSPAHARERFQLEIWRRLIEQKRAGAAGDLHQTTSLVPLSEANSNTAPSAPLAARRAIFACGVV
jgi:hypothetical protein